MVEYLKDLSQFLYDWLWNWGNLTTGGVIVALLWLYTVIRQTSIPRKVGIGIAVVFLVFSAFNAWRQQKIAAKSVQMELEKRFNPNFSCRFHQWFFVPSSSVTWSGNGKTPYQRYVFLEVTIGNSGAPSIAAGWQLSLTTEDQHAHIGRAVAFPNLPAIEVASGHKLFREDCLAFKQVTEPIATGAIRPGWLAFGFDAEEKYLFNPSTLMTFSFEDINQKEYHFTQTVHGLDGTKTPLYYPGFNTGAPQ